MKYELKTIVTAFNSVRESIGNRNLNITKQLYSVIISLPDNPIYYLIFNNTRHKYKVLLEQDEEIILDTKIFISTLKPLKAYKLSINEEKIDSGFATIQTSSSKQKITEEEVYIANMQQEHLNHYLDNSLYLNTNPDFNEYLYSYKIEEEILQKISFVNIETNVFITLCEDKTSNLINTHLHEGVLYSNNIVRIEQVMKRIKDFIPTKLTTQLKIQRSQYVSRLQQLYVMYSNVDVHTLPDRALFHSLCDELELIIHPK